MTYWNSNSPIMESKIFQILLSYCSMWGNLSACTKCQIVFRRKIVRQEVSKCRSPLPIPQQGKQAPSSAHCPPPLSPSATRCERRSCQPGRTGCWLDEVSWQLFTILGPKYKYKWQVQVQVQYQYKWSAGSSSQYSQVQVLLKWQPAY